MNRFILSRRHQTGRKRPAQARPVLELLEDRTVLSTLTVLNALDSGAGSLRDAIKAASSGDIIRFDSRLSGQTITLTSGELAISKSLDIEGPGAGLLAISGNNQSRVFNVSQNQKPVTVTIAYLTIEDGLASGAEGGGIKNDSSTLNPTKDVLSNNGAVGNSANGTFGFGGAVFNAHGANLAISGCTFSGNEALGSKRGGRALGGSIYNWKATATITGSTFTNNLSHGGDGGSVASGIFHVGLAFGGAVFNEMGVTLTVTDSTFTGNKAVGGNGGSGAKGASFYVIGLGVGGAISSNGGTLTISGTTFLGNQAIGGAGGANANGGDALGGGFLNLGDATLTECIIVGNAAIGGTAGSGGLAGSDLGGGVYNAGSVSIDALTAIYGNSPDNRYGC